MVVDPAQDVGEPGARVGAVQLGGDDERVDGRSPVAATVGATEHPGPAAKGHAAQGELCPNLGDDGLRRVAYRGG